MMSDLRSLGRPGDWWELKLSPLLASGYATAFLLKIPLLPLLPVFLSLLLALSVGAVYTSILNDYCDLDSDARCGKANRLAGRSSLFRAGILLFSLSLGFLVMWLVRTYASFLFLYIAAWLTYTAYSVPPLRLKGRGFWGALADATGSEVLPRLMIVVAICDSQAVSVPLGWATCLSVWSLVWGLRGIACHQFWDSRHDQTSQVRTWVTLRPGRVQRLVECALFPIELLVFLFMMILVNSSFWWPMLAVYLAAELIRQCNWSTLRSHLVIVKGYGCDSRLVLGEFYVTFYPLIFLLSHVTREPASIFVLLFHLALFPQGPRAIRLFFVKQLRQACRRPL